MELLLSSVPSDLSIVFIQGANLRVVDIATVVRRYTPL